MPGEHVEVDDRAFLAAFPAAIEELKVDAAAYFELLGEKVVERAQALVPKRTGRLAESIHAEPMEREEHGVSVTVVAGGPGIRETIFVEFGAGKMAPEPYMRPALAEAAGALRGLGVAARLSSSDRARLFARRARLRAIVRRQRRRGALTTEQALLVSRAISQRFKYRGERRRRSRAAPTTRRRG